MEKIKQKDILNFVKQYSGENNQEVFWVALSCFSSTLAESNQFETDFLDTNMVINIGSGGDGKS
jgi:hypothetical protein